MRISLKLFSFVILFFSFTMLVSGASYDIDAMFVKASILENGDMTVQELIVTDGNFNSFQRVLTYKDSRLKTHEPPRLYEDAIYNGTSLKDVTVSMYKLQDEELDWHLFEQEFTPLNKTYYKEDALSMDYVESSIQDGKVYTMYYDSQNEQVAFLLTYTITDVVVLHEDCAEIYWSFLRNSFDEPLGSLKVELTLPFSIDDRTSSFIHGDITGNIKKSGDNSLEASFAKLSVNTDIFLRVVFPKDAFTTIIDQKQTHLANYEQIIRLEEERFKIEKATYERNEKILNLVNAICLGYLAFLILWTIFVFFRYQFTWPKKGKQNYSTKLLDIAPAHIDLLIHNEISYDAFCASLLSLVVRKKIKIKQDQGKVLLVFNNKDEVTYPEELLIDFLFEKVSQTKVVSLNDLEKYMTNPKKIRIFMNFYHNWLRCLEKDAQKHHFFENNGLPIITGIFGLLLMLFVLFAGVYFKLNTVLPMLSFALTLFFCIYSFLLHKRTSEGERLYQDVLALKHFLQDFDKFSIKELPAPKTWPNYFVYASLFGMNEDVLEKMSHALKNKFMLNKRLSNELNALNTIHVKVKYALLLASNELKKNKE